MRTCIITSCNRPHEKRITGFAPDWEYYKMGRYVFLLQLLATGF